MPSPLPFADAGDIVRASSKDEEYVALLETSIREFMLCVVPNSTLSTPRTTRLISTAARLLYFLAPVRKGLLTTPGEEYAAVVPVIATKRSTSLVSRRVLILGALLQMVRIGDVKGVLRGFWRDYFSRGERFPGRAVGGMLDAVNRLHASLFYWRGAYGDFGRRLLGVRYLRVASGGLGELGAGMRVLGAILGIGVGIDGVRAVASAVGRVKRRGGCLRGWEFLISVWRELIWGGEDGELEEGEVEGEGEEGRGKCILCLRGMKEVCLTSCGHVFCWRCICEWCASKEACPLCRQEISVRKLVCLYNY